MPSEARKDWEFIRKQSCAQILAGCRKQFQGDWCTEQSNSFLPLSFSVASCLWYAVGFLLRLFLSFGAACSNDLGQGGDEGHEICDV